MLGYFVNKKITTLMLFAGICLWGLISIFKLPVQMLPDIEFAKLTIITPYENAAPSEVEKLITKNIEESVTSVNGVMSIYSESIEGLSIVTAQFQWGTNMDLALIETKEKVDMIKGELPEDTGKSIVIKFDPKADPISIYSVVPKSGFNKNARKRIEKEIVPYLERIDGVAVVDVSGGFRKQVNVNLDAARLFAYTLSLDEVMQGISIANYSFPAGYVNKGSREYMIRTTGEFTHVNEIGDVVVGKNDRDVPVYLRDIAEITDGYKDRKCLNRFNGSESIGISIRKEPGKNTIAICDKIDEEFEKLKSKYSNDFEIAKIYDQSDFIRNSISNVNQEAIGGALISIFVLFFFLREFKAPLLIITSIPISLLGTFALMYFKGSTLNTISLGGLALGIGIVVDAGTVVIESIRETLSKHKNPSRVEFIKSVISGTREIAPPVFVGTMSTIIVFLPIVFISGISGAIFGELALTISFSLIFSFLAAVTLVPMLYTLNYSRIEKSRLSRALEKPAGVFNRASERMMDSVSARYRKIINYALSNPKKIFISGIIITVLGLFLFVFIDFELMPKVNVSEFTINIELPKGTPLESTSEFSDGIEKILLQKKYVKYVYAKIGSDPEENIIERTSGKSTNNVAIQVILNYNGSLNTAKIISELKNEINASDSIKMEFELKEDVISSILAQKQKPLNIQLYGEDRDILKEYGNKLKSKLSKNSNIINPTALLDEGYPEFKVIIDRDKMSVFGASIQSVAATLKTAITGEVVSKFRTKDDEVDIRTRLRKEDRLNKESLSMILMKEESGEIIPLSNFISIQEGIGPNKIVRSNQSRVNIISADINGSRKDVYEKAQKMIDSLQLPDGYSAKIVGEKDEIKKSLSDLTFAFILSIVLIYMLLASQFQSFTTPVLIMLSIPVASFGVSFALLITGKTLNINSGIGIILLAGNVVNGAIILYDIIEKELHHAKQVKEAIIRACEIRMSAILNASMTTILGMIPIAIGFGQGSEVQQPLAIAVIGGLTFSTFLTMVYLPTLFYIIVSRKKRVN